VFDSEYFRTVLQADVDLAGGSAVVALNLVSGRSYRLRSVVAVHGGIVAFEAYTPRIDPSHEEPRWKAEIPEGETAAETHRAVVAYECIADVTITPVRPSGAPKIGFARP